MPAERSKGYAGGGGEGGRGGWLLGANGTNGATGTGGNVNGTVPLTIFETTEPIVNASINGGSSVPLLVDTGSTGLVIPLKDIGLQHLGLPTGIGMGSYSGGDTYFYLKFNSTINFGNGIVSSPTTVDAVFFSFPGSFSNFASSDGAVGILGVGDEHRGPDHHQPDHGVARQPRSRCAHRRARQRAGVRAQPGHVLKADGDRRGRPPPNLTYTVQSANGTTVPTGGDRTIVDSGGVDGTLLQSAVPGGSSRAGRNGNQRSSVQRHPALQRTPSTGTIRTVGHRLGQPEHRVWCPSRNIPIYIDYTDRHADLRRQYVGH